MSAWEYTHDDNVMNGYGMGQLGLLQYCWSQKSQWGRYRVQLLGYENEHKAMDGGGVQKSAVLILKLMDLS